MYPNQTNSVYCYFCLGNIFFNTLPEYTSGIIMKFLKKFSSPKLHLFDQKCSENSKIL